MDYRRFGQTEQRLSVFSLGTMRLVHKPTSEANSLVQQALSAGINHLETAPAYGHSEALLGEILAPLWGQPRPHWGTWQRDDIIVTTKVSPTASAQELQDSLHQSLSRLRVDYIDNLAFHGINEPDHLQQVLHICWPVVKQALAAGLIRHVGFSTHAPLPLILEAIHTGYFEFVNLHYHLFQQRNAAALVAAQEQDMGVFIISPADKGGMLYQAPDKLVELCQPFSPLETAYRFLLADSRIHTLSLGVDQPEMVQQAQQALQDPQQWQRWGPMILQRLLASAKIALSTTQCAQCYACLPCPAAIHIPEVLRLRNLAMAFDMKDFAMYRYNMFGRAGHWFPGVTADHCTECGDCLPRCPEHLPIPQLLFQTHDLLHQAPIQRLWE